MVKQSVKMVTYGKFLNFLIGNPGKKVVEKAGIDSAEIDETLFANLFNYNWGNPTRVAVLEAIFLSVPAISVNRQCTSSLDAVALAVSLIMTGAVQAVLTN